MSTKKPLPTPLSDYYTVSQAATKLRLSRGRIWQLIDAGRLAVAFRLGAIALISRQSVAEFKPRDAGRPKKDATLDAAIG